MKTCLVYVMEHPSDVMNSSLLAEAVLRANKLALPLCVVYVMSDWSEQTASQLGKTEQSLADVNIPLIVLIGQPDKTLAGFLHHTKPTEIIYSSSKATEPDHPTELATLTTDWPGVVIPLKEISVLAAEGKLAC